MSLNEQEFQVLVKAGRSAIEYRILGILSMSRSLNEADESEMDGLTALLDKYDELMKVSIPHDITATAANNNKDKSQ